MKWLTREIVYPEGDSIEIERDLGINELVDLNGNPISLPLPTYKMIVFRVYRKSTTDTNNGPLTRYYLEQLPISETSTLT